MPWSPLLLCGGSLQRSRVGILGFGKIGQATLRRLVPFGISSALYLTSVPGRALAPEKDYFNLLGPAPYAPVSPTSLIPITPAKSIEDLVSNVDFLIITCSLSPATHHLISLPLLKQMKPSSYVINIARGPIVKTDDLLVAIETGLIAGAGLDVVEGEPNIGGEDTEALVKERRVVVLPHLGSATHVVRDTMGLQAVEFVLQSL
jgi:glyoxylate/hydroxypyruvate reductase